MGILVGLLAADSRQQQWEERKKLLPSSTRKDTHNPLFQEVKDCPSLPWSMVSTLGLLTIPLSPGISCSWLCPRALHAPCPHISSEYECSNGGDPSVTRSGFLGHVYGSREK